MSKMTRATCGTLALTLVIGAACAGGDDSMEEGTVATTESGLEYEVLRAGDGARPTIDDEVVVHYRGTLTDGSQFDGEDGAGDVIGPNETLISEIELLEIVGG